jgi:hypothetical protein
MDLDELVEHWTVLDDERALVDAKHGASGLGFAVLLKHYTLVPDRTGRAARRRDRVRRAAAPALGRGHRAR